MLLSVTHMVQGPWKMGTPAPLPALCHLQLAMLACSVCACWRLTSSTALSSPCRSAQMLDLARTNTPVLLRESAGLHSAVLSAS